MTASSRAAPLRVSAQRAILMRLMMVLAIGMAIALPLLA